MNHYNVQTFEKERILKAYFMTYDLNYRFQRLDTQPNEATNQNLVQVPDVFRPMKKKT